MRASILYKKIFQFTGVFCCFAFIIFCFVYSVAVKNAKVVRMNTDFSFVVKRYDSAEVGSFESQQLGGAGYAISVNGESCVAVSVYDSVTDAERIQNTLGEEYYVYTMRANDLYLLTHTQKRNAQRYQGAFDSLNGCIQVLSQEIKRLESGATQQSSKRVLDGVQRQLEYLAQTYKNAYPVYAEVCEEAEKKLGKETENIIYAQKLRYLLCWMCEKYCDLTKAFLP